MRNTWQRKLVRFLRWHELFSGKPSKVTKPTPQENNSHVLNILIIGCLKSTVSMWEGRDQTIIIIITVMTILFQVIEVNNIHVEGQTPILIISVIIIIMILIMTIITIMTIFLQVIEVNNINVEGQTPNHVLNILREAEHTITFKLIPNVGAYLSLFMMTMIMLMMVVMIMMKF